MMKERQHLSYEEKMGKQGLFNLEKRFGGMSSNCINLKGGYKDGARLISLVPSGRIRGSRHQLRHRRLCLNIRTHFLTMGVAKHWHKLPRDSGVPLPRGSKSHLDMVLGRLALGGPAWAGMLDQITTSCCLQPQPLFDTCS